MTQTSLYEKVLKTNKPWRSHEIIGKELNLKEGTRVIGITIYSDQIALRNAGLKMVKVITAGDNLALYFVICEDDDDYNLLKLIDGTGNLGLCHQL